MSIDRPWLDRPLRLPPGLPTMMSAEEVSYLGWLTAERWDGRGDIVEFGPWLGGSTWALAHGMRANATRDAAARLHAVDTFVWQEFMDELAPGVADPPAAGQTFLPLFRRNLATFGDLIEVHVARLPDDRFGDIQAGATPSAVPQLPILCGSALGERIAIAFLDGAKSWSALVFALRLLGDRMAGDRLLVFQDLKDWASYWVTIGVGALLEQEVLEPEHVLPKNTVTFRAHDELPAAADRLPDDLATLEPAAALAHMGRVARLLENLGDRVGAHTVQLGGAAYLVAIGDRQRGLARFREVERGWPVRDPERLLERMRPVLRRHTGEDLAPSMRSRGARAYHRLARLRP